MRWSSAATCRAGSSACPPFELKLCSVFTANLYQEASIFYTPFWYNLVLQGRSKCVSSPLTYWSKHADRHVGTGRPRRRWSSAATCRGGSSELPPLTH